MIDGRKHFSPLAMTLDVSLEMTLQRLIGLYWVIFIGFLTFRIRTMCVSLKFGGTLPKLKKSRTIFVTHSPGPKVLKEEMKHTIRSQRFFWVHLFESSMNLICCKRLSQKLIYVFCYHRLNSINKQWSISRAIGVENIVKVFQNNGLCSVIIHLPPPSWITDTLNGVSVLSVRCFLMEKRSITITINNPQVSWSLVPHGVLSVKPTVQSSLDFINFSAISDGVLFKELELLIKSFNDWNTIQFIQPFVPSILDHVSTSWILKPYGFKAKQRSSTKLSGSRALQVDRD